jgi:hypothetical protein
MAGLIVMEFHDCYHFIEHRTEAHLILPPIVSSLPSSAGEEPVGNEGDQRHEYDRPEQGGEQQREQNPEYSERSASSTKTKASSAEAPPLNQ